MNMNKQHARGRGRQLGFTMVEMMIAIVAGIVVTGAAVAFTITSIKANSDYVSSTRLVQDLRNSIDFITADVRRAGYDQNAMLYVANPSIAAGSAFAPILVDSTAGANCMIFAYDRPNGTRGTVDVGNGEVRAVRRATTGGIGVIEVAESFSTTRPTCGGAGPDYSAYPIECNATSGWCPLTDPRILDIATFTIGTSAVTGNTHGLQDKAGGSGFNAMKLREYRFTLTGSLVKDPAVTRTVRSNVKVRADCIRSDLANCVVSP